MNELEKAIRETQTKVFGHWSESKGVNTPIQTGQHSEEEYNELKSHYLRACVLLDDTRAHTKRLAQAMQGLFNECAMMHKHWGENSNQAQADAAQSEAREALAAWKARQQ